MTSEMAVLGSMKT